MTSIYLIDPDCPRVVLIQKYVLVQKKRHGETVRDLMADWVCHHAATCGRCLAWQAAKGPVDG